MIYKVSKNKYRVIYNIGNVFHDSYYLIYLSEINLKSKNNIKICYLCNFNNISSVIYVKELSAIGFVKRTLYYFPSCIDCFELFVFLMGIGFVFDRVGFVNRIGKM